MGMIKISILAPPLLLVVACSPAGRPPPQRLQTTVLDPLTQQEQRARDVQKTIDAAAGRERRAVEAQERGDATP